MNLSTPVSALHKVGTVLTKKLERLQIKTIADLLYHFPFRYEDYSETSPIAQIEAGQEVTIHGVIEMISSYRSPRKKMLLTEAIVADKTGQIKIVWFQQPYIKKVLAVGDNVYMSGKVRQERMGLEMISPAYEKEKKEQETTHTARIVPMYPLTAGITQKQLRFLMQECLPLAKDINDWLPDEIRKQANVLPLQQAMTSIHFPRTKSEQEEAQRRIKFDELFLLQLRAEKIRQSLAKDAAPSIPFHEDLITSFIASLPFPLTQDQKVATWEIIQDMQKETPMNRLLEGDVGVGKTIVAGIVLLHTVHAGYQAVLMAPTEILAKQHLESLRSVFCGTQVRLALFTRTMRYSIEPSGEVNSISKKEMLTRITDGSIDICIGTHALLGDGVLFKKLGLIIVDEQHRFGVAQRKAMKEKSGNQKQTPHFLSMTATPIPRSFALTLYGDLDLSIIRQKPAGRKEIKTRMVEPHNRQKAYQFILEQIQKRRQVFVICPLIDTEQSEQSAEKKSVMSEYKKLQEHIFPTARVGYVHGKMKSAEKDDVMNNFAAGALDILVATSVVEVGVNIPNASVMMIEDAERFGLAQLHQFRGRVGRGEHQSYCFLFTNTESSAALERLAYFESHTDGFEVAEYDLQTRGPGEVYGTNQSGMQQFRLATMNDIELIKLTRDIARGIHFSSYPTLLEKIGDWEKRVHLE